MSFIKLLFIKSAVICLTMTITLTTYACITREMLEDGGTIVSNSLDSNYNRQIRAQMAQEEQCKERSDKNENRDAQYIALRSIKNPRRDPKGN